MYGKSEPHIPLAQILYFFCGEDVIIIVACDSFNRALTVLTHVRFGQLYLRTRILILVVYGLTETLLQLVLN